MSLSPPTRTLLGLAFLAPGLALVVAHLLTHRAPDRIEVATGCGLAVLGALLIAPDDVRAALTTLAQAARGVISAVRGTGADAPTPPTDDAR